MLPLETLATRYVVATPALPELPAGREQAVRIIATEPDTELVYDPPQDLPTHIAAAGSFVVSSDQPFGISVYGYGQYTSYWFAGGFKLPTFPIE